MPEFARLRTVRDHPINALGRIHGTQMMAAELHSATVLKNCLKEVEELGPSGQRLAEHLREFLASYDMNMIQKIVAQIPVTPGTTPAAPTLT